MVDQRWEAAVSALHKASLADIQSVCHAVAESICQDGPLTADKFSSVWSIEEWWQVREVISSVFKKVVGKAWTREQISENLGSLKEEFKKAINDTLAVHHQALRRKLLQDTSAVSKATMTDFDWKLKLALSSDKLSSLQEPLLQVDFDVSGVNGDSQLVSLELNKAELAKLISSLEGCSKSVQQLTTS